MIVVGNHIIEQKSGRMIHVVMFSLDSARYITGRNLFIDGELQMMHFNGVE
jgi:hypothetical protein